MIFNDDAHHIQNGMIKMLKITKEPSVPLPPYFTSGINTDHANRVAAIGYSDQENVPEIAISQIEQTMMPSNSDPENNKADTFRNDILFSFMALISSPNDLVISL